jgi:NAD(P)-dependent dehydrogenase (short-subunit alcohol dehydrogenase family)
MKNYVVIGGSSGIGESIVSLLEKTDAKIFATYNTHPKSNTNQTTYHHLDVADSDFDLSNLPDEIHGLVYCPGTINLKPFKRFKDEDFIEDYKIQVLGAIRIIRLLLPKFISTHPASIVLFSTVAVQQGFTFHSQVASSKGAIEGLTRALSAEFAPKIRVNAIAPSLTNTNLVGRILNTPEKIEIQGSRNPMKRVGKPDDIAEAAVYLLSDKSSWVTGQILHIDGGYSTIKG